MTRHEHLQFCKICTNRKLDMKRGLLCGLTGEYADFEGTCKDFQEDEKEKERQFVKDLAATGHSQVGSATDYKKNKEQGGVIAFIGILIAVGTHAIADSIGFFILPYGAIIWGGIQYLRGVEQEKIYLARQEHEEKHDKAKSP